MKFIGTVDEIKEGINDAIDIFVNAAKEVGEEQEGAPASFSETLEQLDLDVDTDDIAEGILSFVFDRIFLQDGKIYVSTDLYKKIHKEE